MLPSLPATCIDTLSMSKLKEEDFKHEFSLYMINSSRPNTKPLDPRGYEFHNSSRHVYLAHSNNAFSFPRKCLKVDKLKDLVM